MKELKAAFKDIKKLLHSKKTQFIGGTQGLQAKRSKAIFYWWFERVATSLMHPSVLLKYMDSQRAGVPVNFVAGQILGWLLMNFQSLSVAAMQRYTHYSMTQRLQQNAGLICVLTNGQ